MRDKIGDGSYTGSGSRCGVLHTSHSPGYRSRLMYMEIHSHLRYPGYSIADRPTEEFAEEHPHETRISDRFGSSVSPGPSAPVEWVQKDLFSFLGFCAYAKTRDEGVGREIYSIRQDALITKCRIFSTDLFYVIPEDILENIRLYLYNEYMFINIVV